MPGLPLVALAHVEDLQVVRSLVQLGHGQPLDPLGRQPLLAPARHPAREIARDPPDADGGGELGGVQRIGVVAADEHDGLLRSRDPRQPRAEAGLQHGIGDRAGDVGLVELERGADVDHRRVGLLDLARGERLGIERPAFQRASC